ncbi:MAG: hypothetical protein MJA84_06480 [Firmicutes bacterium]|nr:hypothetical protein [Bacillota bacterium]
MRFKEIDEYAARQFFAMLKDAPSIRELQEQYPGMDNVMHVLSAQLATYFVTPFLEGRMSCEDLAEAFRRYLYTAFAFGVIMRDNDGATSYVLEFYNRGRQNNRD